MPSRSRPNGRDRVGARSLWASFVCQSGTPARSARPVPFKHIPPGSMTQRSVCTSFTSSFRTGALRTGALQCGTAVCLVGLSACGGPPADAPGAARPGSTSEEGSEAPAAPAPDASQAALPESVTGTFDVALDQCAPAMTMARLTLTPDSLLFYYGYATVETVTPRDGGYDVEATLVQQEGQIEVRPEAASYRIEPEAEGHGIKFGVVDSETPSSSLVRCP